MVGRLFHVTKHQPVSRPFADPMGLKKITGALFESLMHADVIFYCHALIMSGGAKSQIIARIKSFLCAVILLAAG